MVALLVQFFLAVGMQVDPRFVMVTQPGETMKAEIYDLEPGDPTPQVHGLLDDASGEVVVVSQMTDGLVRVHREGSLPFGPVIIYAASASDGAARWACRLTSDPEGTTDNAERALRWCLSFITDARPTVILSPITPPSQ